MKCRACGERFAANHLLSGMGGQESPGTFLSIAAVLFAAGGAVPLLGAPYYWLVLPWLPAAFVLVQCFVATIDCSNVPCPKCGCPHGIWPWSR
ncbi:MAG: hypothetical protein HY928_02970 [Elusimicrobia bacterium]|nr:hypothetical protein [Elusimicrobiota bacterium]